MIKRAISTLLYLLYPKRCKLCGEVIRIDDELCEECAHTKMIGNDACIKCGREKENCVCKRDKYSPKYKGFAAPYYYEGSVAAGVKRLKDNSFKELAPAMGEKICKTVGQRFEGMNFDYVTSVPLSKRKLIYRGFNQSELLARNVARCMNAEYKPLLVKLYETRSQRSSSAKQRRINLYGAFDLAKDVSVEGKTVLIVDDVKTTGSTLNECASVLMGYKAKAVYAASFCVTNMH